MRKAGLLQKLTQGGARALAADMRFAASLAFYGRRVGPDLGPGGGQPPPGRPGRRGAGGRRRRPGAGAGRPPDAAGRPRGVVVKGVDVWVKLARCTTVPRDPIIGFVTRGHGVSVHREDCPTPTTCAATRTASSRSSGTPRGRACSRSPSRSRPWTGPSCCATSPRSCPTTTSTSCRPPWPPAATGWPPCASPSSWPTSPTWPTSCPRSRRSRASTTPFRVVPHAGNGAGER